jgi:PAP2 superfamily
MIKLQLLILLVIPLPAICQQGSNADSLVAISIAQPPKQKPFRFITNTPANLLQIAKAPFKKSNLKGLLITAGATALLLPFDQQITDGVKHFSRQIDLRAETDFKVPVKWGNTKILKIPQNLNSALYQVGEGGTSMLLAGGLFVYGKITHNKRAVSTAADLTETFITMGITTQVIKRITGRQSPFMATVPGGEWNPFPSFRSYQNNTSNYDAFPSGHLATMMATVTTLVLNYPEKKWIKPVGYSLMALSSFAMINTDVHWIADYPLAVALGYVAAKITHLRNHPVQKLATVQF